MVYHHSTGRPSTVERYPAQTFLKGYMIVAGSKKSPNPGPGLSVYSCTSRHIRITFCPGKWMNIIQYKITIQYIRTRHFTNSFTQSYQYKHAPRSHLPTLLTVYSHIHTCPLTHTRSHTMPTHITCSHIHACSHTRECSNELTDITQLQVQCTNTCMHQIKRTFVFHQRQI